jgi:DNA-binding MarR family transcriptional regulator
MRENQDRKGAGTVTGEADENREIFDALGDFIKQVTMSGQQIATDFGVAASDLIALLKLDGAVPMKELAHRMACDASFVTAIADTLERHGLARREPSQRDRRVKNLVLTPEGAAAKERVLRELAARMPWCGLLDEGERRCFLRLLRKMTDGARGPG